MYQVVNNMNTRLCELVPISRPLHTHYTRKKHLITGKVRKLKSTILSIVSRGPQIWNKLEGFIKMSQSFLAFKKNLKQKLLSTYIWRWWNVLLQPSVVSASARCMGRVLCGSVCLGWGYGCVDAWCMHALYYALVLSCTLAWWLNRCKNKVEKRWA